MTGSAPINTLNGGAAWRGGRVETRVSSIAGPRPLLRGNSPEGNCFKMCTVTPTRL